MEVVNNKFLVFSTGTIIESDKGNVGIDARGQLEDDVSSLTPQERIELAGHMINRWARYREGVRAEYLKEEGWIEVEGGMMTRL